MEQGKWKKFILLTLSGLIVCMIIGIIAAGRHAILPGNFAFQFTLYGLFGSLFYSTLKLTSMRDFIFLTILLIIFDFILLGGGNISKGIIHGIYAVFFAGSIYVFVNHMEQDNAKFNLANIFSLSGIVAVAFMLTILVLTIFPNYKFEYSFLEGQTIFGLLFGLGLAIGFQIYYRFFA